MQHRRERIVECGRNRSEDECGDHCRRYELPCGHTGGARNDEFVAKFRAKYGPRRVTSDPLEAGYFGIYLWKQAVEDAGNLKSGPVGSDDILKAIRRQSWNAPEGVVYLDPESLHTWKVVRVGRIRADGQFDVVWNSGKPIRPVPYPIYRTAEAWRAFLGDLHRGWGGKWANETDN